MKIKRQLTAVLLVFSLLLLLSACNGGETNESRNERTESVTSSTGTSLENGESQPGAAEKNESSAPVQSNESTTAAKTERTEKETNSTDKTKAEKETHSTDKTEAETGSKPFEASEYETKKENSGATAISSRLRLISLGSSNGVMCAEIKNVSDSDMEYCLLKAAADKEKAEFVLSVLPKGETAVVSEKSGKPFSKSFLKAVWSAENELLFSEPIDLMSGTFETLCTDGALEIKNKTAEDIDKPIYICYKTVVSGKLTGSVSFRMKLDGIKAKETKQLFSENVSASSRVMYIKYGS